MDKRVDELRNSEKNCKKTKKNCFTFKESINSHQPTNKKASRRKKIQVESNFVVCVCWCENWINVKTHI